MMGYSATNGWQSWMLVAMLIWPPIVAAAVWALVVLTRDRRTASPAPSRDEPMDILRRRFASGRIGQDEYLEAIATLENDNRPTVGN